MAAQPLVPISSSFKGPLTIRAQHPKRNSRTRSPRRTMLPFNIHAPSLSCRLQISINTQRRRRWLTQVFGG